MQHTITLSPKEASDALKDYFKRIKGIDVFSVQFTASQNYDFYDRPTGGYNLTSVVLDVKDSQRLVGDR